MCLYGGGTVRSINPVKIYDDQNQRGYDLEKLQGKEISLESTNLGFLDICGGHPDVGSIKGLGQIKPVRPIFPAISQGKQFEVIRKL